MPWTSPPAWTSCGGHFAQDCVPIGLTHAACRGVLNIVHGTRDVVNWTLDHPDIKAISFVGSDAAGQYIYERGSKSGKRVQVCEGCVQYALCWSKRTQGSKLLHVLMSTGSEGSEGRVPQPVPPAARCRICRHQDAG